MTDAPREGDIVVTGIRAQALVSRAIKLGSVLRFQAPVARAATVAQVAVVATAIVLAVAVTRGALADIGVLLAGAVASIVAVWVVARIGMQRSAYWAQFSHSGVAVRHPETGELVIAEALAHGVSYSPIGTYAPDDCRWIRTDVADHERDLEQFRAFAHEVVRVKARYGFVVFASLAVYCITASLTFLPTLVLMQSGTAICSGFVCDALRPAGYIWEHEAFFMMPADIIKHFGGADALYVQEERPAAVTAEL